MKNHDDALWLLAGIRPIEVNEVAIASSKRSRLSVPALGAGRTDVQNRLHMRIFRPPWSG